MQLRIVPAGRGAQWVRQGFRIFFARPLSFMGLFGVLLMAMLVSQLLPWVGPLLFSATLPLITLGFMLGTQQALQGRFPTPRIFIAPLRGTCTQRALWQLGALYAVAMFVVALVYLWIDGGRVQTLQAAAGQTARPRPRAWPRSSPTTACSSASVVHSPPACSACRSGTPRRWCTGAGSRPARRCSSAPWPAGATRAAFAVYALTGVGAVMAFALACALVLPCSASPAGAVVDDARRADLHGRVLRLAVLHLCRLLRDARRTPCPRRSPPP